MEFDLKEVGATIILGAYFLFGLEVILYLLLGDNSFLRLERSTRFTPRALLGLSVALCFASGMLMEDVSDKFVDRETWMQRIVKSIFPFAKTDDDIKVETLYGDGKKLDRLAREMANRHLFCNFGGPEGRVVESSILETGTLNRIPYGLRFGNEFKSAIDIKSDAAKQIYYHAKNIVYLQDNYYDELKRIQLRIDFARSFLAISFLLLVLTIVVGSVRGLKVLRPLLRRRRGSKNNEARLKALKFLGKAGAIVGILFAFCALAAFSYQAEERQFDLRAYGYFSSLHASGSAVREVKHQLL